MSLELEGKRMGFSVDISIFFLWESQRLWEQEIFIFKKSRDSYAKLGFYKLVMLFEICKVISVTEKVFLYKEIWFT